MLSCSQQLSIIRIFLYLISLIQTSHSFGVPSHHTNNARLLQTKLHSSREESSQTYTVATKKKLIEKAKEIDPDISTLNRGSYAATGWSNRLGTVLTPAAIPGVYVACRPFYWNKIDVGGRMTVIELPSEDGNSKQPDLFIHSPVQLDEPLKEALAKIGTVKHVVSPNYEHVKYAKSWNDAYPDANMWACPGMMEREPDVGWKGEIPFGTRPSSFQSDNDNRNSERHEDLWDFDIIQPMHLDFEVNPFTNKAFFNEVVFYHTPSKTLLFTDAYWNYPRKDGVPNSNYDSYRPKGGGSTSGEDSSFVTFDWELAPSVEKVPMGSRLWKFGVSLLNHNLDAAHII